MSNIIGVRNNNTIVPYVAATRRTKEINLTGITGTSISSYTATAIFYADSTGKWRMRFNISVVVSTGMTQQILTLANISTAGLPTQAISCTNQNGSQKFTYQSAQAESPATLAAYWDIISSSVQLFSGDIALASEPTTYTTAANMEGVQAVDVYIAPQIPGVSTGLVPAQGLDGRTDGVAVPAGKVGEKVIFTERAVTSGTLNYVGTALSLGTLGVGTWQLFSYVVFNASVASSCRIKLSTNNASNSTGLIEPAFVYAIPSTTDLIGYPLMSATITVPPASSQDIYGKATSTSATVGCVVGGYAIRIA